MSDQNVTQSTLASVLNRSQAAVSRRLNGSVEFNITELHAIAELLDVDVAQLLGAEGRTVRSAS